MRGIGLPQKPPGTQPMRDALKLAVYRTLTTAIRPLRASLATRRLLRRIELGKRANYEDAVLTLPTRAVAVIPGRE